MWNNPWIACKLTDIWNKSRINDKASTMYWKCQIECHRTGLLYIRSVFFSRSILLTDKLMLQGFLQFRLMSAFRNFYGRYKLLLSHTLSDIVKPYLAHWLWHRITPHSWSWSWAHGGCDRSTGHAYSSQAPDPSSDISGVLAIPFISLTCNFYLCFETDHYLVS
jgi:hypothetical protein